MVPKISVITICRNEESRIRQTLQSIVGQSFHNFELIVIDGASTDGTLAIINEFRGKIKVLISEPDLGIYDAQNKGARAASGEYLIFLNGGDYFFEPGTLEKVVSGVTPNADILYGDILVDDGCGHQAPMASPKKVTARFLLNATLWHPTTFIRRQTFEALGPYDLKFKIVADYDFFLKAFFKGKCKFQHLPGIVAVFYADGVSAREDLASALKKERRQAQLGYLSPVTLLAYELAELLLRAPILGKICHKIYRVLKGICIRP